jgi:plasmid stability protein
MGQILVRAIPDDVLEAFKARAKREGLPAEALARRILTREAGVMSYAEALAGIDRLRAMTPKKLESSVPILRALRDGTDEDL